MKYKKVLFSLVLSVCLALTGCKTAQEIEAPEYDKPLPPGAHALRKITDPSMIPNMTFQDTFLPFVTDVWQLWCLDGRLLY